MRYLVFFMFFSFVSVFSGYCQENPVSYSTGPHSLYNSPDIQPDKEKDKPQVNLNLLIEAKKEALIGNTEGAITMFRHYIDRYPKDDAGFFELARLEANRKNFTDAIRLTVTASRLDPENIWYQLFLADIYQQTGNYKEAIDIFEPIVSKNPENLDYYYQLASLYLRTAEYKKAAEIYNRVEEKAGISEEISIQKNKIYLKLNDLNKAETELKNLVLAFPAEIRYYSILAEFYIANGKQTEALETYKKIAQLDPNNAYIHMSLADFYRKAGNKEKAYEELKLGFANPNLDIDTKVNILLSFYTINQIYSDLKDQAFTLSEILVRTHPNDPKAHSIYGDLLLQDKKFAEARESFLQVIKLDSSKYVVWEQLLRLDLQLGEYPHLAMYGQRAIELFPDQPLPYLFLGLADYQLKKYEEGLQVLNTGIKLIVANDEMQSQFYMYLGDTYHALLQDENAFKSYEKSLQIKGTNAYVLNNYAYYLSLSGKELDKAESMAQKAVELDPKNASFQDTYGWVLYKKNKFREAHEWIEKALEDKDGVSAEVMEHFGDVLYQLGEVNKAHEYWLKAKKKGEGSSFLDKKILEKKLYE